MKTLSELIDFLENKMSMRDIYQPAIILFLLENSGTASKNDLAKLLSGFDNSVQEYYEKIVMRWPKKTLTSHKIIEYDKETKLFLLTVSLDDLDKIESAKNICEDKIREWIQEKITSPQKNLDSSKRYKILKAARGKCELCGISAKVSPIDIDHIVPRSFANKKNTIIKDGIEMNVDDERNLQALCFRCNRAKRNTDSTDFRISSEKIIRDKIAQKLQQQGKKIVYERLSQRKKKEKLLERLVEEHSNLISEHKDKGIDVILDMIEILIEVAKCGGFSGDKVIELLYQKREEEGAFTTGTLLKRIVDKNDND